MSFEGYYRAICKNGHLRCGDCYAFFPHEKDCLCSCGERFVWTELIDQTNGLEGIKQTKLRVVKEAVTKTCPLCGITQTIEETTYKPTKRKVFII